MLLVGGLAISIQGLSLFYYSLFHRGQLTQSPWGTEEKKAPGTHGVILCMQCTQRGLPSSSPRGNLESQEEEEGSAESAAGHCNIAQCFCGNDVPLIKTELHKWTHST